MMPFKKNVTRSIDNLNIIEKTLNLVYGDKLPKDIDKMLEDNIDTKSGANVTINNTVDNGKFDWTLLGNCEQQTYEGKNIFDGIMELGAIADSDGTNTPNDNMIRTTNYINLDGIRKIAIPTSNNSTQTAGLRFYNSDKQYLGSYSYTTLAVIDLDTITLGNQTQYYTSNDDIYYLRFVITTSNDLTIKYGVMDNTTSYEPYVGGEPAPNPDYPQDIKTVTGTNQIVLSNSDNSKSQTFNIHLGDIELNNVNLKTDTIEGLPNNWKIKKNTGKIVYDGIDEEWRLQSINENGIANFQQPHYLNVTNNSGYCNEFIKQTTPIAQTTTEGFLWQANDMYIRIKQTRTNTVDAFKTWLGTHNATIYYELKTETEITISDATLISDLNKLYNEAVAYEGQTNITTIPSENGSIMSIDVNAFVTEKEV